MLLKIVVAQVFGMFVQNRQCCLACIVMHHESLWEGLQAQKKTCRIHGSRQDWAHECMCMPVSQNMCSVT